VALNRKVPSVAEANAWAHQHGQVIEAHGEVHRRDDAAECLEILLSHRERVTDVVGEGDHARTVYKEVSLRTLIVEASHSDELPVLEGTDIRVTNAWTPVDRVKGRAGEQGTYLLLRLGSNYIDRIFRGTKWTDWSNALRKLDGTVEPKDPLRFRSAGKVRAIAIPAQHWTDGEDEPPYSY
jgi:hypothetical protein